jgi:hypothetical protein
MLFFRSRLKTPNVRRGTNWRAGLPLAVFFLISQMTVRADALEDYQVKAQYLIKFIQYTGWPRDAFGSNQTAAIIGVLGNDHLVEELERYAADAGRARPLVVRKVSTLREAEKCQLVFIANGESDSEAEWLEALSGKPILTVGDSKWTIKRGGVVQFVTKDEHVRFEVNLAAGQRQQLKLSGQLLTVAAQVYKRLPPD